MKADGIRRFIWLFFLFPAVLPLETARASQNDMIGVYGLIEEEGQAAEKPADREEDPASEISVGGTGNKMKYMDTQKIIQQAEQLTTQEKVAQLFVITPEALTGVGQVTAAGEQTKECFDRYPVGGLIYFSDNLISEEQISEMLFSMQDISLERLGLLPFLAVDEEGGSVRRLSGRVEGVPWIPSMRSIGESGETAAAYDVGMTIGTYLHRLGFTVDFAPVADVLIEPSNTVIGERAFGDDPAQVSEMVAAETKGLQEAGILAALKHFPGHGGTLEDSHLGAAVLSRTYGQLKSCELLPFLAGIEAGAEMIMAGHISCPVITGDDLPASLSYQLLTEVLREDMGYDGLIVTDALNMSAVSDRYDSGQAALMAFQAGADLLLMPADFYSAYQAMLNAVNDGTIAKERLDQSLVRILRAKNKIASAR